MNGRRDIIRSQKKKKCDEISLFLSYNAIEYSININKIYILIKGELKMKKKLLTSVLTCGALLTMSGAFIIPTITTSSVIYAADSSVADTSSTRSITLTKYQATDLNDHSLPGDGKETNPNREILQNVQFKLQRVIAEPGHSLKDAATDKEGKDYTVDTSFSEQIATTGVDGKITWNLGVGRDNDGIYLITEVDNSNAQDKDGKAVKVKTSSNPFFVQVPMTNRDTQSDLIYNVVVEPKNVIVNDLNPEKTINGKVGDSVISGEAFQWELTTGIPTGLYEIAEKETVVSMLDKDGNQVYDQDGNKIVKTFKEGDPIYMEPDLGGTYYDANKNQIDSSKIVSVSNFMIADTLDKDLNYVGATHWAYPKGLTTPIELPTAYYTLIKPGDNNGTFVMELTKEGIVAIGTNTVVDKATNAVGEIEKISVHMTNTVDEGFNGLIPNTFETLYQTPGGKPVKPEEPTVKPKTFNGGFDIEKVDKADNKIFLKGAVFHIAISLDDAEKGKFLATDGNSYTRKEAADGEFTLLSATSDDAGWASFNGLPLIWNDTNLNNDVDDGDSIQKEYWVVETTAPEGYELLKSPQKVDVNLNTAGKNAIEFKAEDVKKTNLPFTGGTGTILIVTIALGAIGFGTAIIVMNRKRNASEA